jgi:hypothetical protein
VTDGARTLCVGNVEVTATDVALFVTSQTPTYGRRRLGGRLRRGTPGTDFPVSGIDGLDLSDAANQSTVTSGGTNYLYLLEPFGLPRWARYTDFTTGSRQPRSPRGIPVVSNVRPCHFYGCPSSPITLPTSTGLGSTTTLKGVAILALGTVGSTSQIAGAALSGRRGTINSNATTSFFTPIGASSITSSTIVFLLSENVPNLPPFARSVNVTLVMAPTSGTNGNAVINAVTVFDSTTGNSITSVAGGAVTSTNNAGSSVLIVNFDLPWPAAYAGLDGVGGAIIGPVTREILVSYQLNNLTGPVTSASLTVNSWETY